MKRLTFDFLEDLAAANGFSIDRNGKEIEHYSNEYMPGITGVSYTVTEAYSELYNDILQYRKQVIHPVTRQPY
jgi:hypothetical protein